MENDFKGLHLLQVTDFSRAEIEFLFKYADNLKHRQKAGVLHNDTLCGRTLAMIFEKPSTRTRVSFEVAMVQLGGSSLYLSRSDLQMGRGETVGDTARVLSRYVDGVMARVYVHSHLEEFREQSSVPVINGLSEKAHPCQALADLFTVKEKLKTLSGVRMAYIGDGNNVANSLIKACALLGVHLTLAIPAGYEPDGAVLDSVAEAARESGSRIYLTQDPVEAVTGVNVIYTDVWTSMGQEEQLAVRKAAFAGYQVNTGLLKAADEHAIVMHCLPAHRGEEITDDVIDGPQAVVWDEAENRLHVQKAILALLMQEGYAR